MMLFDAFNAVDRLRTKPYRPIQARSNSLVRLLTALHLVLTFPYYADWKQPDPIVHMSAIYRITKTVHNPRVRIIHGFRVWVLYNAPFNELATLSGFFLFNATTTAVLCTLETLPRRLCKLPDFPAAHAHHRLIVGLHDGCCLTEGIAPIAVNLSYVHMLLLRKPTTGPIQLP